MAQVLKDEQRNKIISAAKTEFAENGISATSMRAIANKAGMTVGNLYRYFKNKNEIATAITAPLLTNLNKIVAMLSGEREIDSISLNEAKLKQALFMLADCVVEIEDNHKEEMLILINDDEINKTYFSQLFTLIQVILTESKPDVIKSQLQLKMTTSMIAKAIFTGLNEGVRMKVNCDMPKEEFRTILKAYLLQCTTLLAL